MSTPTHAVTSPSEQSNPSPEGLGLGASPGSTFYIPFTPRVKKTLALAQKTAREYGHNYVGSEHLILGIIREAEGMAARLLASAGITGESVCRDLGLQTPEQIIEARELAEYKRLKAKYDKSNAEL